MSLYTLKSAKLFLFNCLIALFFTSVQTLNAISLIAWHPLIGEDFATSGSFITKVSCDDATYSTFSILAGGDGALFDIQNSDELIVKTGSNLTSGSYTLKLGVSNGSLTYQSTFTIEVITDKYQPRVEAKTGYFNLVLTTNGDLYGAGRNANGELGLGHNTNPQITPQVISASSYGNKRILEIDATHFLTVMLTDDGVVYTWGENAGYALGSTNSYNVPTAIPASSFNNKYIVKVDSGIHCAAYLAQDGTVYTTSQSTSYRGTSSGSANLSSPTAVDTTGVLNGKFITEIQCVDQQSVVMLSSDKLLFGFGKNSFGELGQNNTTSSDTPISLTFPSVNDPAKIAHKMSRGIYVIDSAGDLYYAGSNTSGQAGLNSTADITVFTKINSADYGSQTIDSITSSLAETFLYTSSGSIYGTGRNHKNQLALGDPDTTDRLTFQLVPTAQFSGKTPSFAATNGWALRVIFTDGYHGVIGDNWSERHMVGISDNPITPFTIVGNTGSGELNLGTHSAITAPAYWLDATQNMANFSITWSSYELDYAAVL